MTTVERKEYNETKILRTKSPVRSSQQNLTQFDSNLDYLLEDLQNTVSRPGSSLGQCATSNFKETTRSYNTLDSGRSSSLSKVTNVKAANPVTEYASDDAYSYASPDGRQKVHGYKKEKYMYKSNTLERDGRTIEPERNRMQNSINQLDSLLDDLQQVKNSSYTEKGAYNSTGYEPTHQTVKTTVNRELHYGDSPKPTERSRTLEKSEYQSRKEYSGEGTYGDIRPLRQSSPSPSSRTSTLSRQTKVANVHEYPIRVVETPVPDMEPEVLAALDPKLHPPGNTKVTTTIKTYTYEIPGSGSYPTDLKMDKTVDVSERYISGNESITTPSKSFVYEEYGKKENRNIYREEQPGWKDVKIKKNYKETTTDNVEFIPAYQKPVGPSQTDCSTVKETVTTRNYQPGYQPHLDTPGPNQTYIYNETTTTRNVNQDGYPRRALPPSETYIINKENNTNVINQHHPDRGYPGPNKTYIYEEHNTTRNVNDYPNQYPRRPQTPSEETYIINKEHNTNVINKRPMNERGYPVYNPPPSKTTYHYKESNTTNHQNGGPPRERSPKKEVETFHPNQPPYRKPDPPINIQYSYKSTNTTENRYKGGYPPDGEGERLLPRKFPTDDGPDGPPKRIDDLMATIGREPPNSPLNAGFTAHEQEIAQQRKIDCIKEQNAELNDKKEVAPASKNVTGPPVYYPPGHEMFAKKEEGGGGWRAEGAYGKASGKYMYEAESGSKSKSKKGMAVVPVCLPLCCGLPCTIL